MKRWLFALTVLCAVCAGAEDKTFTIAARSLSTTITNTTDQRWYLKSVYALQAGAVADVVSLKKVSGSTDVVIKSQTMTTNAVDVNIALAVPSTVYLSPGELMKIVRADTNHAITGFVVTSGVE